MEISDAQEMMRSRNIISAPQLEQDILKAHIDVPRRQQDARLGLQHLFEGQKILQSLGHNIQFVEGPAEPPLQFPQMLHRPGGLTCIVENTEQREKALKEGWTAAPAAAA